MKSPRFVAAARALVVSVLLAVTTGGFAALPSGRATISQSERIEAVSRRYLGKRYRLFPLGEGSARLGSPKPLIDERSVDCVTFVEQSIAHALASAPSEVMPLLQRIRYRSGTVHFGARNHYFLADWANNNGWLVEDVTRRIGGARVRTMRKTLNRGLPARKQGVQRFRASLPASGGQMALTVTFIPSRDVAWAIARFPDAGIVAFVPARNDMDASHVGFVFRAPRQRDWTLRHASSTRGRVVDEPLLRYVRRRGRSLAGVVVLRFRNVSRPPGI